VKTLYRNIQRIVETDIKLICISFTIFYCEFVVLLTVIVRITLRWKYTNVFRLAYSQWKIVKVYARNFPAPSYFPHSFSVQTIKNRSKIFHEIWYWKIDRVVDTFQFSFKPNNGEWTLMSLYVSGKISCASHYVFTRAKNFLTNL
jgi:hypothetical protein